MGFASARDDETSGVSGKTYVGIHTTYYYCKHGIVMRLWSQNEKH